MGETRHLGIKVVGFNTLCATFSTFYVTSYSSRNSRSPGKDRRGLSEMCSINEA